MRTIDVALSADLNDCDRDPGPDLPRGGTPGHPHRVAERAMPGAALRKGPPPPSLDTARRLYRFLDPIFLFWQTILGSFQECRKSG